ncbi:MAG: electron transfer flavoprotein subunit beta/FixA family protein [Deltaproteobacteria bacterium]|nr:electron transfer flavoprotein subunit beta/FixA family protein [Deltaproteobacteria bacterium]
MTLKVAILVKQVPDLEAIVQVKSADQLDIEDRYVCSFFDEIAIEAALTIKNSQPDCELVALSVGGRRASDALRRSVAMGIDRVEQLGDESHDQLDAFGTAQILAARLKTEQPQIVLCGKQAGDDDMSAVGPMLAELLGIVHVSAVVALEVDSSAGQVRLERAIEGGQACLTANLPILISAEKGLAEPHIPVVTRVMKAMKAKIEKFSVEQLDIEDPGKSVRMRHLGFFPAPSRPEVKMLEQPFPTNVNELVRCLKDSGVLS